MITKYRIQVHGESETTICSDRDPRYSHVTTGSGTNPSEAIDDCLDMIEFQDFDIKILEEQTRHLRDRVDTEFRYYITIYWS